MTTSLAGNEKGPATVDRQCRVNDGDPGKQEGEDNTSSHRGDQNASLGVEGAIPAAHTR